MEIPSSAAGRARELFLTYTIVCFLHPHSRSEYSFMSNIANLQIYIVIWQIVYFPPCFERFLGSCSDKQTQKEYGCFCSTDKIMIPVLEIRHSQIFFTSNAFMHHFIIYGVSLLWSLALLRSMRQEESNPKKKVTFCLQNKKILRCSLWLVPPEYLEHFISCFFLSFTFVLSFLPFVLFIFVRSAPCHACPKSELRKFVALYKNAQT